MKKVSLALAAGVLGVLLASTVSRAEINVNIGINLPVIAAKSTPGVVVIPGTYVYLAPDIEFDVFFFGGYWWRPHGGKWYRAVEFGNSWVLIESKRVPGALHRLPPGYRDIPPGLERIPPGQLKKKWRQWEKERHWEKAGWKHMKEEKRESREKKHGKGRHD